MFSKLSKDTQRKIAEKLEKNPELAKKHYSVMEEILDGIELNNEDELSSISGGRLSNYIIGDSRSVGLDQDDCIGGNQGGEPQI